VLVLDTHIDDLADDDPDVVAGMERLRLLKADEGDVSEIRLHRSAGG